MYVQLRDYDCQMKHEKQITKLNSEQLAYILDFKIHIHGQQR